MPPKRKRDPSSSAPPRGAGGSSSGRTSPKGTSGSKRSRPSSPTRDKSSSGSGGSGEIKSAGYLITCDVPTRQYITYLNKRKTTDKKFIIEELDATHLLVKKSSRSEIEAAVEKWMDDNVFSAIERVGENLDMS
mmetsp:Transcript_850/g.1903  ORF Transcript_850/g.1903 Transcript_850/m.1903 type:complete len:134 (+) Transcript_850:200-601(+)